MWELVFDRSDCHVYDLADHVVDGLPSVLAYCDLRNGDRRRWRGTLHHLDPCYVPRTALTVACLHPEDRPTQAQACVSWRPASPRGLG